MALDCLDGLSAKDGSNTAKATPALLKLLSAEDPISSYWAAAILWRSERHSAAVTACAKLLAADPRLTFSPSRFADHAAPIAERAANLLCEIGPEARAALPSLRQAVAVKWSLWFLTSDCENPNPEPPDAQLRPAGYIGPSAAASYGRKVTFTKAAYRQWREAEIRIQVGTLAQCAIDKIEAQPKK